MRTPNPPEEHRHTCIVCKRVFVCHFDCPRDDDEETIDLPIKCDECWAERREVGSV